MKFPNFFMNKSFLARLLVLAAGLFLMSLTAAAQNPAANLDQCRNGGLPAPPQPCAGSNWVNGNVGTQNAQWKENDFLPYRMLFSNLTFAPDSPTSHVYTLVLGYDIKHSGAHAIDYLGSYNTTDMNAVPCDVGSFCSDPPSVFPISADTAFVTNQPNPNAAGSCPGTACISQIAGELTMWGGTIKSFAYTGADGTISDAQVERQVTITFTAQVANPVLSWGGHVGFVGDWGSGNSAGGISGSPYHMRLKSLDGAGGNQDRSLSAAAVAVSGAVRIQKEVLVFDCTDSSNTTFNFGASTNFGIAAFTLQDTNPGISPCNTANGPDGHTFSPGTPQSEVITAFGPTNSITVSELVSAGGAPGSPTGYTLSNVNCVETGSQDSTKNSLSPTATIVVQPNEVVTCTFTNTSIRTTAAPASITGQVITSDGSPLSGISLRLTDVTTGEIRTATTNTFGFYTFDNLTVQDFYQLTITSKRYRFSNPSRTFTLSTDVTGMDFFCTSL